MLQIMRVGLSFVRAQTHFERLYENLFSKIHSYVCDFETFKLLTEKRQQNVQHCEPLGSQLFRIQNVLHNPFRRIVVRIPKPCSEDFPLVSLATAPSYSIPVAPFRLRKLRSKSIRKRKTMKSDDSFCMYNLLFFTDCKQYPSVDAL
jgi:hypothetical protein